MHLVGLHPNNPKFRTNRKFTIRGYNKRVQNANMFLRIRMYLHLPNMLIKVFVSVWYEWWRLKSIFLAIPTPTIFTFTYLELGFTPPPTPALALPLCSTVRSLSSLLWEQIFFLRNLIGGQPTIQYPSSFLVQWHKLKLLLNQNCQRGLHERE